MSEYTQYDLLDALTLTAGRLGWEIADTEINSTHARLSFRNPAMIERMLSRDDHPSIAEGE